MIEPGSLQRGVELVRYSFRFQERQEQGEIAALLPLCSVWSAPRKYPEAE